MGEYVYFIIATVIAIVTFVLAGMRVPNISNKDLQVTEECWYVLNKGDAEMTEERRKKIQEWCEKHCQECENHDDTGCLAENEVIKDVGIACVHFERKVK